MLSSKSWMAWMLGTLVGVGCFSTLCDSAQADGRQGRGSGNRGVVNRGGVNRGAIVNRNGFQNRVGVRPIVVPNAYYYYGYNPYFNPYWGWGGYYPYYNNFPYYGGGYRRSVPGVGIGVGGWPNGPSFGGVGSFPSGPSFGGGGSFRIGR